ncbi:MAG: PqqD family protein [Bacteroidaceae bacterium]|nr:PqqD family protein [Bacteroidaceae bacterium]
MKIKEGFRMRKLGRENIVVPEGLQQVNFNRMIVLNETAAFLWQEVQNREFDADTLRDLLLENYEVSPQQAQSDVEALVQQWIEADIIEK